MEMKVENTNKERKKEFLFTVGFLILVGIVGIILLGRLVFIQDEIIQRNQTTIINIQNQHESLGKIIKRLNPTLTIERYLKEQKLKQEENFVLVIEKLQPKLSPSISRLISNSILNECEKKNIDENLILALIYAESSIDPMRESNMGACGLMQVRYKIWKEQPELKDNGVDKWNKLFWVEENIKAGTDIFKKFYEESDNNINTTLYRYNSGSPKIPEKPNEEVLKYINKIMYYHYYIQNLVRGNNETSKGFNR